MGTGKWPFPGDSPTAILRRVAGAYRARLSEVDPEGCAAVDERMISTGQGWVVVRKLPFDMDDWLSCKEAADLACVQVCRIARMRRLGKLKARQVGRRYQFRAADVVAAFAEPRTQRSRRARVLGATVREEVTTDGVENRDSPM